MNEKGIAEIRRRFNSQKTNISSIHGCYVSATGEIMSEFSQPLATLTPDEADALLGLIKKSLSGKINKNLLNIDFSNDQVLYGNEHKRLLKLRDTAFGDDEARRELYAAITENFRSESGYAILAAYDTYDIFSYGGDGSKSYDSAEQFRYFVCCVCPIKLTKPQLGFSSSDNPFKALAASTVITAPELGFMFPAFDDRAANVYSTLFYTKSPSADFSELTDALFEAKAPMPAVMQKESFDAVLSRSVGEECNLEVIKTVHEQINEIVSEHKERRENEPLTLSKGDISEILRGCDITNEHIEGFEKEYDETFGSKTRLSPQNLVDTARFELRSSDLTVKVNPERSEIVKTQVIDGVKYILIRADEEIEVNGIKINIEED